MDGSLRNLLCPKPATVKYLRSMSKSIRGFFLNDAGDELNSNDRKSAEFASAWFARQFPDPTLRRKCAMFLARGLEVAHSKGANRWRIGLKNRRLRLVVGKLVAIQLASDSIRIGVIPNHLSPEIKRRLDEVGEWLSEHDTTPASETASVTY